VQPRPDVTGRVLLFDGEIALDASRGALVRLRGHFLRVNERKGVLGRLMEAVAFIDYENAEREERYWLPSRQRIELQVASPMTGEGRAVIRVVSRFGTVAVNDTTLDPAVLAVADSMMDWYIATGEPMGKAGAYAIQGEAAVLVDGVQGSITNVIGLPLTVLDRLMTSVGISLAHLAER